MTLQNAAVGISYIVRTGSDIRTQVIANMQKLMRNFNEKRDPYAIVSRDEKA